MEQKYNCKLCNYYTERINNLKKHKLTRKHLYNVKKSKTDSDSEHTINTDSEQISEQFSKTQKKLFTKFAKNVYACDVCNKKFTEKTSMYRHKRLYCNKPKKVNNPNDEKSKEILELKEQNKKLLEVVNKNADTANKNADASIITAKNHKQSMRMMTHAIRNLANAPVVGLLEKHDAIKLLEHNETNKHSIEDLIIYYHRKGLLGNFIGDMIITSYKKENPEEQSFWSTDTSRLSFIVMQLVSGTGENEWVQDKSGLKINKMIIMPLLDEIKNKLTQYLKIYSKKRNNETETDFAFRIITANEIILEITNKTLHKEILKFIAPSFGFDLSLIEKFSCAKCTKQFSINNAVVLRNNVYCGKCADILCPTK